MSPGRSVKSGAWLRASAPVTFPVICNVTLSSLLAITSHFWTKCIPDARRSGPFSISYRHKKEIGEFINDSETALPYPADSIKSLLAHLRITDACSNYVLFIFMTKLGTQDQFTHLLISFDILYHTLFFKCNLRYCNYATVVMYVPTTGTYEFCSIIRYILLNLLYTFLFISYCILVR